MKKQTSGHICLVSIHDWKLNTPPMAPKPQTKSSCSQEMHSQGQVKVTSYPYLKVTCRVHNLQDQVAVCSNRSLKANHSQWGPSKSSSIWALPAGSLAGLPAFCLWRASSDDGVSTASPRTRLEPMRPSQAPGVFWTDFTFNRAGEVR